MQFSSQFGNKPPFRLAGQVGTYPTRLPGQKGGLVALRGDKNSSRFTVGMGRRGNSVSYSGETNFGAEKNQSRT